MLFAYSLYELSSLFFSTNHPNYARCMPRYALELQHIKDNKSSLYNMLLNGGFSVRRSDRRFCRVGVDMALEQSINAEAKNRLRGILRFADVQSAVNRWLVTSSMRTQIVQRTANMSSVSNMKHRELKPYRIEKDANDLSAIINSLGETLNPFLPNINCDALYNMKNGKKWTKKQKNICCFPLMKERNGVIPL